MVWYSEEAPAPVFLLADGASGAGGLKAIQATREVAEGWKRKERYNSRADARQDLCQLVTSIHEKIKQLRPKGSSKNFETTLIAGMIYDAPPAPVLLLVRYGDSGFLVTHEAEGSPPEGIATSMQYDTFPAALGARGHKNFDPRDQVNTIYLERPGVWRVRAFSDGVGSEEEAWELLNGDRRTVDELVTEAAEWPSKYGRIGRDDWSVAGFDITVEEQPTIDSPWKEELAITKNALPFPWGGIPQVNIQNLPFSDKANKFWKHAFLTDPQLAEVAQYPLVKRIFGVPVSTQSSGYKPFTYSPPAVQVRTIVRDEPGRGRDQRTQPERLRANLLPLVLSILVFGLIGFLLYQLFFAADQQITGPRTDTTTVSPTPAPTQRPLTFDKQEQMVIYSTLKSGGTFILNDIPPGSGIGSQRMLTFLSDLARVLREANMRVIIKVHTDSKGDANQSKSISEQRGRNIKLWLETQGKVLLNTVYPEGIGKAQPLVPTDNPNQEKLNRRLEVTLVSQ